jgi:glycosyltransferase involved in cell wall biosynthesis
MVDEPQPKPRILMVVHNLRPGGAENQLIDLARGLAARGAAVRLVCIDDPDIDPGPLEAAGVEVIGLGAARRRDRPGSVLRMARLAREADLVHCTMWDATLWGRIAAILARRPVVVTDHATDRSVQVSKSGGRRDRAISLQNRLLDPFTYATVAVASSQVPVFEGDGVAARKIVYIPNGVPVARLREAAKPPPGRAELGIPEGARVVIHIAQFRPEKNQAATFDAVARLREELGDVHAVFVGIGKKIKEPLERRAAEAGASWAHFLGMRDDIPALLSLSDLLVLPSTSDTMPLSVLEAMALGVPVVASDVGDISGIVEANGAGICVPPGDLDAFVVACRRVLAEPDLRDRLGAGGREASHAFDSETMVDSYLELFEDAIAGRHRG